MCPSFLCQYMMEEEWSLSVWRTNLMMRQEDFILYTWEGNTSDCRSRNACSIPTLHTAIYHWVILSHVHNFTKISNTVKQTMLPTIIKISNNIDSVLSSRQSYVQPSHISKETLCAYCTGDGKDHNITFYSLKAVNCINLDTCWFWTAFSKFKCLRSIRRNDSYNGYCDRYQLLLLSDQRDSIHYYLYLRW